MPASSRMMEFLGTSTSTSTTTATATAITGATMPSAATNSVTSALQLARFYLGREDMKAAQEVLFSLQEGRLGATTSLQVPPALLRPLFQRLVQGLCEMGDAASALEAARRMAKGRQAPSPEMTVRLLHLFHQSNSTNSDLLAAWWGEQQTNLKREKKEEAWKSNPLLCLALLDIVSKIRLMTRHINNETETDGAMQQEQQQQQQLLPSIEEVWTALSSHGPPPASAHVSLVKGLASNINDANAPSTTIDRLLEAVSDFAQATRGQKKDVASSSSSSSSSSSQVLIPATEAMLRSGNSEGLRRVLESLPASTTLYTTLLERLPEGRLDMLDMLWQHASTQKDSDASLPLSLVLAYCRVALGRASDEAHVDQAVELLHHTFRKSSIQDNKKSDPTNVNVHQVAEVLEALCARRLVSEVETLQRLAAPSFPSPLPVPLARALLKCAAAEGKPGRAIALLHSLMGEGERDATHTHTQKDATQPSDYEAVLTALVDIKLPPQNAREKALIANPLGVLFWVFEEGLLKKTTITASAVQAALLILRRACESNVQGEHREAFVQRAVALVSKLAAAGHETDDELCEALVAVAVWGVSLHRALEVIKAMERTGADPAILARAHTLLIGSLARRGELAEAEDWLVRMVTVTGHGPTEGVLDAFAAAFAVEGNVVSGLSMLQGCFTQYGRRPSPHAFQHLFDRCLVQGDGYEAQRAVIIAAQLYPTPEDGFVEGLEGRLKAFENEEKLSKAAILPEEEK